MRYTRQLDTVRAVLAHLQDRLDTAPREFTRLVRLHEAMQELLRMHTGAASPLRTTQLTEP